MITATVCWFDEPVDSLARLIASLHGVVDHAIFLDGAYARFPHVDPVSPAEQYAAILQHCERHSIRADIHRRDEGPWPSQVAKRTHLCNLVPRGRHMLVIDADEYIDHAATDIEWLHHEIASHRPDTMLVALDTMSPLKRTGRLSGTQSPRMSTRHTGEGIARIYRRLDDMRVGPRFHGSYSGVDETGQRIALRSRRTENAELPTGITLDAKRHVRIVNETWKRDPDRLALKHQYGEARRHAQEDA